MSRSGSAPKWKIAENVVTAIERSLTTVPGAKVIPNSAVPERVSGVPRQVDVYIEIPAGPRCLRIGIEVRDKAATLDIKEVEQLITKLKKLDLDYGCIVSRSGFTSTARDEADRNGIELRTISEIAMPHWWLPSTMPILERQVETIHWRINFLPEQIPRVTELLGKDALTKLELVFADGHSENVSALVAAHSTKFIDDPAHAGLRDGDTFMGIIDFRELTGAELRFPGGNIPLPQNIEAFYRVHHRMESVKLAAYERPDGVTAFTGISSILGKQMTFVAQLQADGRRRISFSADVPTPSKTKITPRRRA